MWSSVKHCPNPKEEMYQELLLSSLRQRDYGSKQSCWLRLTRGETDLPVLVSYLDWVKCSEIRVWERITGYPARKNEGVQSIGPEAL